MGYNDQTEIGRKAGGVSASSFLIPVIIVLVILLATVVSLVYSVNKEGARLADVITEGNENIIDVTDLIAGSSLLNESSTQYIIQPVTPNGDQILGPLGAYTRELGLPRRGPEVLARFDGVDLDEGVRKNLELASENAQFMYESQLHALALVSAVYPLPASEPYTKIPLPPLTPQEQAMPPEAKLGIARSLVLNESYSTAKYTVFASITAVQTAFRDDMNREAAATTSRISYLRKVLWVVAVCIGIVLFVAFFVIYSQLVYPLKRFVPRLNEREQLDDRNGLSEVRLVASAYNDLLERRDTIYDILKGAAEKDALTNLPNRYAYQQRIVDMRTSGYSAAVVLFDVDYLKHTNDVSGHAAGDELLRKSARCIQDCFGIKGDTNCYRYGGDEFVAVLTDCTEEGVEERIVRFRNEQKKYDISVSCGYAYTDDIGKTSFRELLEDADSKMYQQKEHMHEIASSLY